MMHQLQMLHMFLKILWIPWNVIQVDKQKSATYIPENIINKALKDSWAFANLKGMTRYSMTTGDVGIIQNCANPD